METKDIVEAVLNVPFMAVLLWLLIQEQRAHLETRKERDNDARQWTERFAILAERVTEAVERLDLPGPM